MEGVLGRAVVLLLLACGCDKAILQPIRIDAGPMLGPGAQVPLPPPRDTDGPSGPDLLFVLRDPILRQHVGERWAVLGWNLDDLCSYPPPRVDAGMPDGGLPDAGLLAGWDLECAPNNMGDVPARDGEECRDNNYGRIISAGLEALSIDVEAEANEVMLRGEFALALRVSDYNGAADDPLVTIGIVQTVYGIPDGGMRGEPLVWDGSDTFYPAQEAFRPSGEPLLLDPRGYVVDHLLVMNVPTRSEFVFGGTDRSIALLVTDATVTGRLNAARNRLDDVVIAGRWGVRDLIDQLDEVGVCPDAELRGVIETAVRGAADVLSEPGRPPGALAPCDALSFAIGLTGYRGRVGDPVPSETVPMPCPPPP